MKAELDVPMVGLVLRRAREREGLTLEELSRRTKIKVRLLEAIEENDFARLPGGIFTRGFLRNYAREVALDPESVVSRYLAQAEPRELFSPLSVETDTEPEPAPENSAQHAWLPSFPFELLKRQGGGLGRAAEADAAGGHEVSTWPVANRYRSLSLVAGVFTLVGLSLVFGMWRRSDAPPVTQVSAAATADVPLPVGTVGLGDVELSAVVSGLKVDLTPRAPCWIAATADGKPALARLMSAQDPYRIEAQEEVTLRIGDPAALAFAVNGVPGRPLGEPGMPVTVRITRQNYRDFVMRR
ncbi:MAG: helix-turn-helix domain-containing protein [Acidobacteria bacterium]|nr:helix-turn-helix domain-containing protein [Acidobacteriota bacterium]